MILQLDINLSYDKIQNIGGDQPIKARAWLVR